MAGNVATRTVAVAGAAVRRRALIAAALAAALAVAAGPAVAGAAAPPAITVDAGPGRSTRVAAGLGRGGLKVQRREGAPPPGGGRPAPGRGPGPHPRGRRRARGRHAPSATTCRSARASSAPAPTCSAGSPAGGAGLDDRRARPRLRPEPRAASRPSGRSRRPAGSRRSPSTRPTGWRAATPTATAPTTARSSPRRSSTTRPKARYLFVNYHTEADFLAATDALIARRPDIVVHSNSFIEGPFDGTGPLARAVDRAAAAGILWFNSVGNYALLHWSGPWADADADGDLDWPNGDNWTFPRSRRPADRRSRSRGPPRRAGRPPTSTSRSSARRPTATWTPVDGSADRQSAGLPPPSASPATPRRSAGDLPPPRRAASPGRRRRAT